MRPLCPVRWGLVAVVVVVATAFAVQAQTITTFDVPDSTYTHPVSINQAGQITGDYADANGKQRGFSRDRDGTFAVFDVPDQLECSPQDPQDCTQFYTRWTLPTSINTSGQIAGYFWDDTAPPSSPRQHGFVRESDSTFSTFTVSDGFIRARAINAAGQITGWFDSDMPSPGVAFLRAPDGSAIEFEVPDASSTYPSAINAAGQIVGQYYNSDGIGHGFVRNSDGTFSAFDVSGSTYPMAIDSNGQTAGFYVDSSFVDHGFLRASDGTITTFDVPGSANTAALGLNLRGQTTGFYADSSAHHHGFLREQDGTVTTFDVPNATESFPTALNSLGRITGWYSDTSGVHGFLRSGSVSTMPSPGPVRRRRH